MGDLISRQAAIDAIDRERKNKHLFNTAEDGLLKARGVINTLPSADPEIKPISYMDCTNALLKMWIDNVLTDGEYNKIMDKLNAKHKGEQDE